VSGGKIIAGDSRRQPRLLVTEFINTVASEEASEVGADYTDLVAFVSKYGFPQQAALADQRL
jgi:hypothetical protein